MLHAHCHSPLVLKCVWEWDTAPTSWTSTTWGAHRCPYMPQAGSVPAPSPFPLDQALVSAALAGLCSPGFPARSQEHFCRSSTMRFSPALPAGLPALGSPQWPCAEEAQEPGDLPGPRTAWGNPSSGLGWRFPARP